MSDQPKQQEWLPTVQALEADRRRIEETLAHETSPSVRQAALAEQAWVERRRREFLRRPVACEARLDIDAGTVPVRVRDVSRGGCLIEVEAPPPVGTRVQLRFPVLEGKPAIWCVVRHASPTERRAGVEFTADPDVAVALAGDLLRRFGGDGETP